MRWSPYIELRAQVSRAVRAKCRGCGVDIAKGSYRAEAIPIVGKPELFHLDCVPKRAPSLCQRKLKDKDPEWTEEALAVLARYTPEGVEPSPRSYQRTPLQDFSYAKDASSKPCVYCGNQTPGETGVEYGHALRAFSLDGERRLHPRCALELAPGLCKRVVVEDSERWPAELRAYFTAATAKIPATPRSPWHGTAGVPQLEISPSARAACRFCNEKIPKGELRISRQKLFGMRRSPVYFHVGCLCSSQDFHPKWLELMVLKAAPKVTREHVEGFASVLPPAAPEDDDVPPLLERLLTLFDAIPRESDEAQDTPESRLTKNVVEFPKGFFSA